MKASNGTTAKPNSESKPKPDIDINVGLSERAPWFCSLCNTKATSRQTLLLHADGKKHRAKARAFHNANREPNKTEHPAPNPTAPSENTSNGEIFGSRDPEKLKMQEECRSMTVQNISETENSNLILKRKRKINEPENDTLGELGNGEVIQLESAQPEEMGSQLKKAKDELSKEDNVVGLEPSSSRDAKKKIKWKKLITSVLKSSPDRVLKMKKVRKLVLEALKESGTAEEETQLRDMLEHKIHSSSRFAIDQKFVRLVA